MSIIAMTRNTILVHMLLTAIQAVVEVPVVAAALLLVLTQVQALDHITITKPISYKVHINTIKK